MDALLMFGAEIMIIGICVWAVATEAKSPEEIGRLLDTPVKQKKGRFAQFAAPAAAESPIRRARPGIRR